MEEASVLPGSASCTVAHCWPQLLSNPCALLVWRPPACAAARSVTAGVLLTSLALGCAGFSRGGFSVNHMDVAPKFAGVVM